MGLKSFKVVLDNPTSTYIVGSTEPTLVSGRVILVSKKNHNVQSLKISIRGKAKVQIAGSANTTFLSQENIFNYTLFLAGDEQGVAVQVMLTKGEHSYPFRLALPPGIPSSFKRDNYGLLSYKVEAVVEKTWKLPSKARQYITVVSRVELNRTPDFMAPPKTTAVQHYGGTTSPMTMVLRLKSRNIVPGQEFPIVVDVQNDTNVDLRRIAGKIKKYTTYRVLPPENLTMVMRKVLCTFKMDAPKKKTSMRSSVMLPQFDETALNLANCSIIDVDYMLIVKAVTSGVHKEAKIKGRVNICSSQAR